MIEFRLPSLGADMDDGTLVEWRVAPGQPVKKGDVVAVVDTSKAAIDVEIWDEGTVEQLLVEVGQKIPVGTPIMLLRAPGEAARAVSTAAASPPPPAPPSAAAPPPPRQDVARQAPRGAASRVRVSPAARQRAAALGMALDGIAGSGADGAVTLADVDRAARPALPAERGDAMRQVIAAAMARSKREIPHYYLAEPVPMRAALDWLREVNGARPVTQRLLPAALLLKAVALALRAVPELNGLFVDGRFRPAPHAHVGVAISLRAGGLVAPALHEVEAKPLAQLMSELADLVQRARAGRLRSSELSDPTITVTQLGDQGAESVFGVIYPPQVALVGFGRIADRPWANGEHVVALPLIHASLSADHRVSDGHRGALFLARLRDLLQRPQDL